MVWHLDVGLSFPKSVGALIGGSAHPIVGAFKIRNVKNPQNSGHHLTLLAEFPANSSF